MDSSRTHAEAVDRFGVTLLHFCPELLETDLIRSEIVRIFLFHTPRLSRTFPQPETSRQKQSIRQKIQTIGTELLQICTELARNAPLLSTTSKRYGQFWSENPSARQRMAQDSEICHIFLVSCQNMLQICPVFCLNLSIAKKEHPLQKLPDLTPTLSRCCPEPVQKSVQKPP